MYNPCFLLYIKCIGALWHPKPQTRIAFLKNTSDTLFQNYLIITKKNPQQLRIMRKMQKILKTRSESRDYGKRSCSMRPLSWDYEKISQNSEINSEKSVKQDQDVVNGYEKRSRSMSPLSHNYEQRSCHDDSRISQL